MLSESPIANDPKKIHVFLSYNMHFLYGVINSRQSILKQIEKSCSCTEMHGVPGYDPHFFFFFANKICV